jgi:energy-coupling factor transporter ATP-binding protein EcfA2
LIEQINTPGQHALLYGDRGVGKSSLANIASNLLLKHVARGALYEKRCDSETTFEEIVRVDFPPDGGHGVYAALGVRASSASNSAGVR